MAMQPVSWTCIWLNGYAKKWKPSLAASISEQSGRRKRGSLFHDLESAFEAGVGIVAGEYFEIARFLAPLLVCAEE